MADPLSVTSGVLTLVVFTLQASKVLYQTVASFQSNNRAIRELKDELEALNVVLESLHNTFLRDDADLPALELPLRSCCRACEGFQAIIEKCTAHSDGTKTSFRDWARLRYLGEDVVGFKNMLAGYKSTIAIALGDANIRKSLITLNLLDEYKSLIANTTADLQEHLQNIDEKLQALSQEAKLSDDKIIERHDIQDERNGAQKCLEICAEVMTHIDQVYPNNVNTAPLSDGKMIDNNALGGLPSARAATADVLRACKEKLLTTTDQLETHLRNIDKRLREGSLQSHASLKEQESELEGLKQEMQQCISICADASANTDRERMNVFEDVSTADDGHQVLVSTIGDLISAKRITAGARSDQWLGQMSDDSLQALTQKRGRAVAENNTAPRTGTNKQFEGRYGEGRKIPQDK